MQQIPANYFMNKLLQNNEHGLLTFNEKRTIEQHINDLQKKREIAHVQRESEFQLQQLKQLKLKINELNEEEKATKQKIEAEKKKNAEKTIFHRDLNFELNCKRKLIPIKTEDEQNGLKTVFRKYDSFRKQKQLQQDYLQRKFEIKNIEIQNQKTQIQLKQRKQNQLRHEMEIKRQNQQGIENTQFLINQSEYLQGLKDLQTNQMRQTYTQKID